jgi:flagellar hook protein FlgE
MLSSLSSGVTGLESFQQDLDVIGNNIANINTTAFKASTVSFSDAFSNTLQGASATTPAIQVGTGVQIASIDNNWSEGGLSNTGVASNLAVSGDGNGFFTVEDPQTNAQYVTRDGTFSVNPSGNLVTSNGFYVMGYTAASGALTTTVGPIVVKSPTATNPMASYTIDSSGTITMTLSDGTTAAAGQVLLQGFAEPQMLVSQGNNLYNNQAAAGPTVTTTSIGGVPGTLSLGTLQSGALESSNVDLSNEMANLITAQQAFDANSKIITTTNEVLQTLVNMKQG